MCSSKKDTVEHIVQDYGVHDPHLNLLFLPFLAGGLHWVDDGTSDSTAGTRVFIDLYMYMDIHMYVHVCTCVETKHHIRNNWQTGTGRLVVLDRSCIDRKVNLCTCCMEARSTT